MDTQLLVELEAVIPTFLSVMALVFFTAKTRFYSYTIILLAIGAELVPLTTNITALLACVSCVFGLMVKEFMLTHNLDKQILQKSHS